MQLFEFLRTTGAIPPEATHLELAEHGRTGQAWRPCRQCEGQGWVRAFEAVAGGRCFPCGGSGRMPVTTISTPRVLAAISLWEGTYGGSGTEPESADG